MQEGRLLDMYARSDITMLARGNSYSRLQWEDMTVEQALDLPQRLNNDAGSQSNSRNPSPRQSSEQVLRAHVCPFISQPPKLPILSTPDLAFYQPFPWLVPAPFLREGTASKKEIGGLFRACPV